MKLGGEVRRRDKKYFILYQGQKSVEYWILVRDYHIEDENNYFNHKELAHPVLNQFNIKRNLNVGYIHSAVKRQRTSGKLSVYGNSTELIAILSEIRMYRDFKFNKNSIVMDDVTIQKIPKKQKSSASSPEQIQEEFQSDKESLWNLDFFDRSEGLASSETEQANIQNGTVENNFTVDYVKTFEAMANSVHVRYSIAHNCYMNLLISSPDFYIEINPTSVSIPKLDYTLLPVTSLESKRINGLSVAVVDYNMLKAKMGGLAWYEDESGNILKDYKVIKTREQFEWDVMKAMVEEYERCTYNKEPFILSMDTETDGLNICSLPDDSPYKNKMCAMPLAWKDNQGVVVFTNMEYFSNVDSKFVVSRLEPFFRIPLEDTKIFDCSIPDSVNENGSTVYRTVTIDRSKINLVGHNTLFDGKVLYDEGCYVYFNNDTMQIAFNMDPELSRGQKGLKIITRKLFHANTPELSDILGKGNEDKYRFLSDEEVAKIYGCADGDFTRLSYKELLKICPNEMVANTRKQDMPLIYSLIPAEYNGLNTDEAAARVEGSLCKANIDSIENLIYSYVGMHIEVANQLEDLKAKLDAGLITQEGYAFSAAQIKPNQNARYVFNISGNECRDVLYGKLKYPIVKVSEKTNLPSVDKKAMERLMQFKKTPEELEHDYFKMEQDLPDLMDSNNALISAEKFNSYKYPLAYLLSIYGAYRKEYTSYYMPIMRDGMNGRLYKSFSTTRIETRRIANPGQTLKANLKKLVKAHGDDWNLYDWDMSQVEYRIMISLAGFDKMIEIMKDPEKDFHTETSSLVHAIRAHQVSKSLRKKTKPISFGIPYGLGERKMCENIFKVVNDDTLYETRKLLRRFKKANAPVIDYLEHVRDEALIPREFPPGFKEFLGLKENTKLGYVKNPLGFWRLFNLEELDNKKVASIRRKAGNYPIQSFAAELFRKALIGFKMRCIKEGIDDKVVWHMLIHDELLFSVHKSLHPFYIYKLLQEECMLQIANHTAYYIGINIGDNWEDCKNDKSEAPIYFVRECIKRWEAGEFEGFKWMENAKDYVMGEKMEYVKRRVLAVLKELYPNVEDPDYIIDMRDFMDRCTNYTVRSYVNELFKPNYKPEKGADFNQSYLAYFETYLIEVFGEGRKIIDLEGNLKTVTKDNLNSTTTAPTTLTGTSLDFGEEDSFLFDDDDEDFDMVKGMESYWSLDSDSADNYYGFVLDYWTEHDYDEQEASALEKAGYDEQKLDAGLTIADAAISDYTYKYVKWYPKMVVIQLKSKTYISDFKKIVTPHLSTDGTGMKLMVNIAGISAEYAKKIRSDCDFVDLDMQLVQLMGERASETKLLELRENLKFCKKTSTGLVIHVSRRRDVIKIKKFLQSFVAKNGGLAVTFVNPVFREHWLAVDSLIDLEALDKFIKEVTENARV